MTMHRPDRRRFLMGSVLAGTGVLAPARRRVWATGSRTSLAALACALVWFALRPRMNVAWRLLLATGLAVALPFRPERRLTHQEPLALRVALVRRRVGLHGVDAGDVVGRR